MIGDEFKIPKEYLDEVEAFFSDPQNTEQFILTDEMIAEATRGQYEPGRKELC